MALTLPVLAPQAALALAAGAFAALALALLAAGAWCAYRVNVELTRIRELVEPIGKEQDALRGDVRGLRQQVANLIGMLLRAGFKPKAKSQDWSDDELETMLRGETSGTRARRDQWFRPHAG